jgi:hypothetical protein
MIADRKLLFGARHVLDAVRVNHEVGDEGIPLKRVEAGGLK